MTKNAMLRAAGCTCACLLLLLADGCHRHRKAIPAENTEDYADNIRSLVAQNRLPMLHWPDYSDYQNAVMAFYDGRENELAWTRNGKPSAQAVAFMRAFRDAQSKGLNPEDYDASLWDGRVRGLGTKSGDAIASFDVAMTVDVMRYVSDLHIGRVNPEHFGFGIDVAKKRLDLAEFVSEKGVVAEDVPKLLASVEPDSEEYRKTEQALGTYLMLVKRQQQVPEPPLPMISGPVSQGQFYADGEALLERLELEGDSWGYAIAGANPPKILDATLSAGVKHYQARHGYLDDGKLTPQVVKSLNVPMSVRVAQLQDALERWRWLPEPYVNPRLLVNLPEFLLRGYTPEHELDFTMKVIAGKVVGDHETPVFSHMMRYLIFRPYWNVPTDIAKAEFAPHIERNPNYLATRNYEAINGRGEVVPYTAKKVAEGGVIVREKPGPKNSLGLVKFMFPNPYDIYLHSTPSKWLFAKVRRDFSHGCVRVQKPEDLAVWVLDGQKDKDDEEWDIDKVQAAMNDEEDNRQVNLKTPLPIVIFYLTAFVQEDGTVSFFDDIYGYDADLEKVLAKGPLYPTKPEPIVVKTKPGDTA